MLTPIILVLWSCELFWPVDSETGKNPGTDDSENSSDSASAKDFCKRALSQDPPAGPDCVSSVISCGETLEATTGGGSEQFYSGVYEDWFCTIPPANYNGPERVFLLDITGSKDIDIDLDAGCGEVDLFAMHWADDTCPYEGVSIFECEGATKTGDDHIDLFTDQDYRFYIVVESRSGDAVNFRLSVSCEDAG
jgi:hypothetical protein